MEGAVKACGMLRADCCVLHAMCRACPMEGAVKACGTLRADVLCAACRVQSLSYGERSQSVWHVACRRAVCCMPCAEPVLRRAQSKLVARCMPTCCLLHAVCRACPTESAVKACGMLHADVLCVACRVSSMEGQPY